MSVTDQNVGPHTNYKSFYEWTKTSPISMLLLRPVFYVLIGFDGEKVLKKNTLASALKSYIRICHQNSGKRAGKMAYGVYKSNLVRKFYEKSNFGA